jgi:hypothetical protein
VIIATYIAIIVSVVAYPKISGAHVNGEERKGAGRVLAGPVTCRGM